MPGFASPTVDNAASGSATSGASKTTPSTPTSSVS